MEKGKIKSTINGHSIYSLDREMNIKIYKPMEGISLYLYIYRA